MKFIKITDDKKNIFMINPNHIVYISEHNYYRDIHLTKSTETSVIGTQLTLAEIEDLLS